MSIAVFDTLSAYGWEREFRENLILAHAER